MIVEADLINDLKTLNHIMQVLNRSSDIGGSLQTALAELIELMGLETGWIFVSDPLATDTYAGRGYRLAAFHNLPPALALNNKDVWETGCDCQNLCNEGRLVSAYNEVKCSRLASAGGDRHGLIVHASAALMAGERTLGILNVAAPDWEAFTPRNLAILANVGIQMGVALERSTTLDLLQEQHFHEQAALLELSQQLLSRRDLGALMSFIVEEARRLVDADAAALLLPGQDAAYLHFRAASGWRSDPVGRDYPVPADKQTGSGRAMMTQQLIVLEDFRSPPTEMPEWGRSWLSSEEFRSAVVVPMVADGRSIGVLLIDCRDDRVFHENDHQLLRLLANQAALAIEKERLHEEELNRHRMDHELELGRKIQMSMLPSQCPQLPGWEFARDFETAKQVAGDFYDFFTLPGEPGRWGVVIADVSDKGVPAALFMALSRTTIRNVALRGRQPAEVLNWANRFIQEDSKSDMYLTAFYAELDARNGHIIYANAGHNPPVLWRAADNTGAHLHPTGPLLGVLDHVQVTEERVWMEPGDVMVLYTDGLTEAINEAYEEFGLHRMEEIVTGMLRQNAAASAEALLQAIRAGLNDFVGETTQFDDITVIVIRRQQEQQ